MDSATFFEKWIDRSLIKTVHQNKLGPGLYWQRRLGSQNLELSQRRAESVRQNLIDHFGIAQERIVAKGFGETRPIVSNETPEGRRKNRRVTVILYANTEKPWSY